MLTQPDAREVRADRLQAAWEMDVPRRVSAHIRRRGGRRRAWAPNLIWTPCRPVRLVEAYPFNPAPPAAGRFLAAPVYEAGPGLALRFLLHGGRLGARVADMFGASVYAVVCADDELRGMLRAFAGADAERLDDGSYRVPAAQRGGEVYRAVARFDDVFGLFPRPWRFATSLGCRAILCPRGEMRLFMAAAARAGVYFG